MRYAGVIVAVAMLAAPSVLAQTEENTGAGFKQQAQEHKEANQAWWDDFNGRRQQALEGYKSQGLTETQIREKMQVFRSEAEAHHQRMQADRQQFREDVKETVQSRREEFKDKLDTNDDGKVDRSERVDFIKQKVDQNGDGTIDDAKRSAFRDRRDDIRDRRENVRDRNESVRDRKENVRDRRESARDRSNAPARGGRQSAPARRGGGGRKR